MVRTREEIEYSWIKEGRDIVFEDDDRQIWVDTPQKELFFVNWETGRLKEYKLVDEYQRKSEEIRDLTQYDADNAKEDHK